MTLHIALIEPRGPSSTGRIARLCAAADVPLHLIGPVGFPLDDEAAREAADGAWDEADRWAHQHWFEFRDAISRERCLYFSPHAKQQLAMAPFRKNSVLVFGNEEDGLPARIMEKHPERCFGIPGAGDAALPTLPAAVRAVLAEGLRRVGVARALPELTEDEDAVPYGGAAPAGRTASAPARREPGRDRDRDGGRERGRGRGRGRGRPEVADEAAPAVPEASPEPSAAAIERAPAPVEEPASDAAARRPSGLRGRRGSTRR